MPVGYARRFKNSWLQPIIRPKDAMTDAIRMGPGTYVAGQVLGQKTDTITGANDVQTLTIVGDAGTFVLSFAGAVTPALPFSVTAAALQTALDNLSTIGNGVTGQVAVTGGPGATAALVITFTNESGNLPQPLIVIVTDAVTGSGHAVTIAHTTTGRIVGGHYKEYSDAASDGSQIARCVLKYDTFVDNQGRVYAGGAQNGSRDYNAVAYFGGYFRTADLTGLDAAGIVDLGKIVHGTIATISSVGTIIRIM